MNDICDDFKLKKLLIAKIFIKKFSALRVDPYSAEIIWFMNYRE